MVSQEQHYTLVYDGTFEGFLSAVYESYERKLDGVSFSKAFDKNVLESSPYLFSTSIKIFSDTEHAERVWRGLSKKLRPMELKKIYAVFLSEIPEIDQVLFQYIKLVFAKSFSVSGDYGNPYVLKVAKTAKMVGREVHRMHAFVRFKLTKDHIYFASIEPDFDVLPLIIKHFKNRYADQKWLIYDLKRKYGIYYDLEKVEEVELSLESDTVSSGGSAIILDPEEMGFQRLWADYFKSTNIKSRKNMKLHVQHVPRRYWKYLSEKVLNLTGHN
ncbi:MAG: TIGR03915 family putative DNA repair protein [Bacteroidota bacterium]